MTADEYARLDHPLPYVLRLTSGEGELLYVGTRHTFDPADPQIQTLTRLWKEFRPTIAFHEGASLPVRHTIESAVAELGEPGLVRWLGERDAVPVRSLEPPAGEEIAHLARFYPLDRLKLFYVLRQVPQFERSRSPEPLERRVQDRLWDLTAVPLLAGPPHTLDDLAEMCAREFPELRSWREVPAAWFDPVPSDGVYTHAVSRRLNRFRDLHMMRVLLEAVGRGERVLAVVGGSHVVMQEPALKHRLWAVRATHGATPPAVSATAASPQ